ncbi:hypothetical protein GC209_07965 [bacterium]|nr:hypothetical protein [bacterium]
MTRKVAAQIPQARVAEVTVFRLRPGLGSSQVIAAGRDIDAWLRQQPGFVSRMLLEEADGSIMDVVVWQSQQACQDSARRLMDETAASAFHDLVAPATIRWHLAEVLL